MTLRWTVGPGSLPITPSAAAASLDDPHGDPFRAAHELVGGVVVDQLAVPRQRVAPDDDRAALLVAREIEQQGGEDDTKRTRGRYRLVGGQGAAATTRSPI